MKGRRPLPPGSSLRPAAPGPGSRPPAGASVAARCSPSPPAVPPPPAAWPRPRGRRASGAHPPRRRAPARLPPPPPPRRPAAPAAAPATPPSAPRLPRGGPAPAGRSRGCSRTAPMRSSSPAGAACPRWRKPAPPQSVRAAAALSSAAPTRCRRRVRRGGLARPGRAPPWRHPGGWLPPPCRPCWRPARRPRGCGRGRTAAHRRRGRLRRSPPLPTTR
mmetsp:Transcript_4646/g.11614  ORF Transcript_4646/g.11614 Transcript_4646/m.11614 type:complete len:218 (-) Transcript_4646:104-757(-)